MKLADSITVANVVQSGVTAMLVITYCVQTVRGIVPDQQFVNLTYSMVAFWIGTTTAQMANAQAKSAP